MARGRRSLISSFISARIPFLIAVMLALGTIREIYTHLGVNSLIYKEMRWFKKTSLFSLCVGFFFGVFGWFLGESTLYLYLRDKCRIENTPTALCLCGLQHGLTGQRKSPKMFIVEINNLGALYDRGHLH